MCACMYVCTYRSYVAIQNVICIANYIPPQILWSFGNVKQTGSAKLDMAGTIDFITICVTAS